MTIWETTRLRLRHLVPDDAPFIVRLLNDPDFIRNIGDRQVRTLEDARGYLQNGPIASYARWGFGLFLVELANAGPPIGICGLLKRDCLPDVDVGFAFLPEFRGRGYAFEAASGAMAFGEQVHGLKRIVAITAPDNHASMKLLTRLGLHYDRTIRLPEQSRDSRLYTPLTRPPYSVDAQHPENEEQARAKQRSAQ